MTHCIRILVLAAAVFLAAPAPAPAGSLSDLVDDLSDWIDDGIGRLRDDADRVARKRLNALERVDRLLGRDTDDLVQQLVVARRVTSILDRGFDDVDADAETARELVGDLLDELDVRYDDMSSDALRGAAALADLVPGASRSARALLATAETVAARANAAERDVVRGRLLERAARRAQRAARLVRRKGGVVGPYTCHPSETGTAAGIVHVVSDTLGAVSATHVDGLVTVTSQDVVSALRLDATAGDLTVRVSFPPVDFDGVGVYEIGPAVGQARADLVVGGASTPARGGTLSVDAFDLEAKTLSGRFDLDLGPDAEPITGIFTICDILVLR